MKTALAAVAAALLSLPAAAQPVWAPRADSVFAPFDTDSTPGLAFSVMRNGELVLAGGYGRASLEHPSPIGARTPFHVASLSKQFTAFAIAMLAEEGRISLNEDIRAYLPEMAELGHRVTVRQLVHHTSGVRDQWDLLMLAGWRLDDVITQEHVLALASRQRSLNFAPGAEHLYSNTGYTLLAEIVARATGTPFPEWMRLHVFEPLGMRDTHFHDDHEHAVPGRAESYAPRPGGGWRHSRLAYATVGATSLFTTAEDLARWLRNLESGEVGGAAVRARMRERGVLASGDTIPYAFGLVHGRYRGAALLQHAGADAGFRSVLALAPEHGAGVVILSNASNVDLGRGVRALLDLALADVLEPPAPAASPPPPAPRTAADTAAGWRPERPEAFVGRYRFDALATAYEVALVDGALVLRHPRHGEMALAPRGPDEFAVAFPGTPPGYFVAAFDRDAAGRVVGMRLSSARSRDVAGVRE